LEEALAVSFILETMNNAFKDTMRKEKLISDQKIFPKQLFLIHSWISI
jgi:hypothetical protein